MTGEIPIGPRLTHVHWTCPAEVLGLHVVESVCSSAVILPGSSLHWWGVSERRALLIPPRDFFLSYKCTAGCKSPKPEKVSLVSAVLRRELAQDRLRTPMRGMTYLVCRLGWDFFVSKKEEQMSWCTDGPQMTLPQNVTSYKNCFQQCMLDEPHSSVFGGQFGSMLVHHSSGFFPWE